MVDDIRPPQTKKIEEKNKQEIPEKNVAPAAELETSHLYEHEDGFVNGADTFKKKFHSPLKILKHASKQQKIFAVFLIAVLVIGGATGAVAVNRSSNKKPANIATPVAQKLDAQPTKSNTEPSRLTGVPVPPELNKRAVTAVMIENSPDARPQSGLKDAGIVYEAIAEGGITRFNALFQESMPDYIGPVRSVRPYYVDLFLPFDAAIAHAGGSAEGLAKVKNLGVKDLDFMSNAGAYRRIPERYAPHNLYTSTASLDQAAARHGWTTSTFKGFDRKPEKPADQITASRIDFRMSSPLYNSHYDYDKASNSYKRSEGGKPHVDARSGQQLQPKVVIALVMNYSQNGIYSVYQTSGKGKMYVFQDGTVQAGNWSKGDSKDQFSFTDEGGKPLSLNAGQTWITLVKTPGDVASAP